MIVSSSRGVSVCVFKVCSAAMQHYFHNLFVVCVMGPYDYTIKIP